MKRTILLTDVEAKLHREIRTKLLMQNYEVIFARNVQEALGHLDMTLIDLVLMDLDLPKSDGKRALFRMTRLNRSLRVIGLTERSDMREGGIDFGLSVVAEKPVDVGHLLSVIAAMLSEGPGLIQFCYVPPKKAKPLKRMFHRQWVPDMQAEEAVPRPFGSVNSILTVPRPSEATNAKLPSSIHDYGSKA